MTRIFVSRSCIFFLCSLNWALSEGEPQACTAADASTCKSAQALGKAVQEEDEGHSLALLQVKGSQVSKKICPFPDVTQFVPISRGCPGAGTKDRACLLDNRAFTQLANAWELCGTTESCGAVMQHTNGLFYLRRASDPESQKVDPGVKLYKYECKAAEEEEQEIETRAEAKAIEIADNHRRSSNQYIAAAVDKEMKFKTSELEEVKREADYIAKAEKDFVAETETKVAAMHKAANEVAKRAKKMTKEAALAKSKVDDAQAVVAEARYMKLQETNIAATESEAKKKIEQQAQDLEQAKVHFQEMSESAAKKTARAKEDEMEIERIKTESEHTFQKEKAKAEQASAEKSALEKQTTSVRKELTHLLDSLDEKKQKVREHHAELEKVEADLKKAQRGSLLEDGAKHEAVR